MALYDPSLASSTGYVQAHSSIVEPKPLMEISLEVNSGLQKSLIPSFSAGDRVEGKVAITAPGKTKFYDIRIGFVGSSSTSCQGASSRKAATHTFLELDHPTAEETLPNPRILEAGQILRLPFAFIIPGKLLPDACRCCSNEEVRSMHLRLPPSVGDTATSGHGGKLRDDFTPKTARISYAIRVIMREYKADGTIATLAERIRKVRVKPVSQGGQTFFNESENTDYRLRHEKTIRKRGFQETLGTLAMEAQCPYCLRLEDTHSPTYDPMSTHAKAFLRFDPAKTDSTPPDIGNLKSELKIITFFATKLRPQFPCREQAQHDTTMDFSTVTLPLASRSVSSGLWTKHESQEESGSKPFYTADLLVPIELPTSKTFVPTFHSCLISRIYRLDISIFVSAMTSLTIKAPLWILSEGGVGVVPESAAPTSTTAREVESMLDVGTPRSLTPPPVY